MKVAAPWLVAALLVGVGVAPATASDHGASADAADATDGGDATNDVGVGPEPCGVVGAVGCCVGRELRFCEAQALQRSDCAERPSPFSFCGWDATERRYDCGAHGQAAPLGGPPFACPGEPPCEASCDGRECGPDGCGGACGRCADGTACLPSEGRCVDACVDVPEAGCCEGDLLRTCAVSPGDPVEIRRDCAAIGLRCGWLEDEAAYSCTSAPTADPRGGAARRCPEPSCRPSCAGAACGPDGCGGICGLCDAGATCDALRRCVTPAMPDASDATGFDGGGPPRDGDASTDDGGGDVSSEARAAEPAPGSPAARRRDGRAGFCTTGTSSPWPLWALLALACRRRRRPTPAAR